MVWWYVCHPFPVIFVVKMTWSLSHMIHFRAHDWGYIIAAIFWGRDSCGLACKRHSKVYHSGVTTKMVSIVWLAKLCKTKINQGFTQSENEQATLKTFRNLQITCFIKYQRAGEHLRAVRTCWDHKAPCFIHCGTPEPCWYCQNVRVPKCDNISKYLNIIQYRYDFMLGDFTYPRMSIGTVIFRISAFWLHLIRRPWNEHEALKNRVAICSIWT